MSGIGKNVREGQTPSMIDGQLFLMDIASRKVSTLTRDFNPSVGSTTWCATDGMVYFQAEDQDSVNLFRLDPLKVHLFHHETEERIRFDV